MRKVCLFLVTFLLFSCGGGGGGSGPSTDACGSLGLPTKSAGAASMRAVRIVNGAACGNLDQSPVVRVTAVDGAGTILGFCSGTVLTSGAVMTAGHCFPEGARSAVVLYGDPERTKAIAGTFRVHPDYQASAIDSPSFAAFNDVAIVTLSRAIPVPPAPILTSRSVQVGDTITIFGYGTDENGAFDFRDLKSGEMLLTGVTQNHLSALYSGEGSNTCQGDSGGPAFREIDGQSAVVGITSTGTSLNCQPPDNSLFTNVQGGVLDFVLSQVPGVEQL